MNKIKENLPLIALIKMQFINKTSLSFKANKFAFIAKVLFYFLLLGGLTTGLYFLFNLFAQRSIFGLFILPIYYFNFLFIFAFVVIIINCIVRFTDDLYLSPDNQFLVTLPVKTNKIFLSKIIVYYLIDLFRSLVILLPLFYGYGICNNFRIGYYFWVIFVLLFALLIPICIASLLSLVILKIKIWFKNNPIKQNIIVLILLLAIFVTIIILFSLIPDELRIDEKWQTVILPRLKSATLTIEKIFYPIAAISMLCMGYTVSTQSPYRLSGISIKTGYLFVILLAFIAICMLINYLFVKKWFIKNIASSYEHKKELSNFVMFHDRKHIFNKYIVIYHKKNHKILTYKELYEFIDKIYMDNTSFFTKQSKDIIDYIRFLEMHYEDYEYKVEDIKNENNDFGIAIYNNKSTHLVLFNKVLNKKVSTYDPYVYSVKSRKKPLLLSILFKDFIRDIRSASSLASNLAVILGPSALIFALNKIYSGFKLTLLGGQLVFAFTILVELLALFIYSMKAASIYSKDQKNAYILNVSPVSYTFFISTKLIHQLIIGIISIALLVFNFQLSTPLTFINYVSLFFMFLFLYVFSLLTCAQIDLKNLDKFNFAAKTSEKAGEQNEIYASLFSIAFAVIFAVISFLLVKEDSDFITLRLMIIALILLILKVIMFISKLVAKERKKVGSK